METKGNQRKNKNSKTSAKRSQPWIWLALGGLVLLFSLIVIFSPTPEPPTTPCFRQEARYNRQIYILLDNTKSLRTAGQKAAAVYSDLIDYIDTEILSNVSPGDLVNAWVIDEDFNRKSDKFIDEGTNPPKIQPELIGDFTNNGSCLGAYCDALQKKWDSLIQIKKIWQPQIENLRQKPVNANKSDYYSAIHYVETTMREKLQEGKISEAWLFILGDLQNDKETNKNVTFDPKTFQDASLRVRVLYTCNLEDTDSLYRYFQGPDSNFTPDIKFFNRDSFRKIFKKSTMAPSDYQLYHSSSSSSNRHSK